MIKEIDFLYFQEGDKTYYGGDQEWFSHHWGRQAGCASVLASDLYYVYKQDLTPSIEEFKQTMDQMYAINTPGIIGFPYFYKFARNFVDCMKQEHIMLAPEYQKISYSVQEGFDFIVKAIDRSLPVGMLILRHRAVELEEENWHWMCITGYEIAGRKKRVIFSSCGERLTRDAHILFGDCHKDIVKLMTFHQV